jgi:hypothetical protein
MFYFRIKEIIVPFLKSEVLKKDKTEILPGIACVGSYIRKVKEVDADAPGKKKPVKKPADDDEEEDEDLSDQEAEDVIDPADVDPSQIAYKW